MQRGITWPVSITRVCLRAAQADSLFGPAKGTGNPKREPGGTAGPLRCRVPRGGGETSTCRRWAPKRATR